MRDSSGVCPTCGNFYKRIYSHRMMAHGYRILTFTDEELVAFDEQSFKNMVEFYTDELRAIMAGTLARDLLGQGERTSLRRHGILGEGYLHRGRIMAVTPEAQALLV